MDLTFIREIQISTETEDAVKVAKETVHETGPSPVNSVNKLKPTNFNKIKNVICIWCNKKDYKTTDCKIQNIIIITL